MSTRLSPKDLELQRAVDEVLHYIWDPIGVSGVPQARDEYHGYQPRVFGLLCNGASEESIADYLSEVSTDRMGLSSNAQHDLKVASILIDWKDAINERFA